MGSWGSRGSRGVSRAVSSRGGSRNAAGWARGGAGGRARYPAAAVPMYCESVPTVYCDRSAQHNALTPSPSPSLLTIQTIHKDHLTSRYNPQEQSIRKRTLSEKDGSMLICTNDRHTILRTRCQEYRRGTCDIFRLDEISVAGE